jgi:hypothetical protein
MADAAAITGPVVRGWTQMAGRRAIVEILAQRMVLNLNIDAAERLSLDLPTRLASAR